MSFALTPLRLRCIPNEMTRRLAVPTGNLRFISSGSSLDAFPSIKSAAPVLSYWPDKNDIEGFARVELKEMAP